MKCKKKLSSSGESSPFLLVNCMCTKARFLILLTKTKHNASLEILGRYTVEVFR